MGISNISLMAAGQKGAGGFMKNFLPQALFVLGETSAD
jgi:hypothetical protein